MLRIGAGPWAQGRGPHRARREPARQAGSRRARARARRICLAGGCVTTLRRGVSQGAQRLGLPARYPIVVSFSRAGAELPRAARIGSVTLLRSRKRKRALAQAGIPS